MLISVHVPNKSDRCNDLPCDLSAKVQGPLINCQVDIDLPAVKTVDFMAILLHRSVICLNNDWMSR